MLSELRAHLTAFLEELERRYEHGIDPPASGGSPTGIRTLDEDGGLGPGRWVLTGEPSIGTTAFVHGAALAAALTHDTPATVVTLADSGIATCRRMVARLAQVPLRRLHTGELDEADWARVALATAALVESPIEIVELIAPSYEDVLLAVLSASVRQLNIGLVAVDSIDRLATRPSPSALRLLEPSPDMTVLLVDRSPDVAQDFASGTAGVLRMRSANSRIWIDRILDRRFDRSKESLPVIVRPQTFDLAESSTAISGSEQTSFDLE